ncbi:MAG: LacI family DNA-binding transcriptional regulator [Oscillospiraceae bacterium]
MKISIKALSELTGFSQATVSNALNNKRGVNRETAEKIIQAARDQGYNVEAKISKIRFVQYNAGGQVMADTPFFSALIDGVERAARLSGFEITIVKLNRDSEDYEDLRDQILRDPSSAILLLGTELTEEEAAIYQRGAVAPIVLLDSWFSSLALNAVLINSAESVRMAVESLIERGHRRIGYLKSTSRIQNFRFRENGYEEALRRHSIPIEPAFAFPLTPTMEGAYLDMGELLNSSPALPTAFFADNDIIALGAMKALQELDYRVPQDVSVIGFDDMPFCSISSPPLTTVRVFKQEMGHIAVQRLVELIQGGDTAITKNQICNEFVERESVQNLTVEK